MDPIEFQLTDAQGEPHEYTISPHATSDGSMLALRVLGMAGEPIGRLASSNLGVLIDVLPKLAQAAEDKNTSDADLLLLAEQELGALEDLDLDLAQIVQDIQQAVVSAGGDAFFQNLLRGAYRDGKPLAKRHVYDTAFQANYRELFQAVWKSIQANGFLLFWGIS